MCLFQVWRDGWPAVPLCTRATTCRRRRVAEARYACCRPTGGADQRPESFGPAGCRCGLTCGAAFEHDAWHEVASGDVYRAVIRSILTSLFWRWTLSCPRMLSSAIALQDGACGADGCANYAIDVHTLSLSSDSAVGAQRWGIMPGEMALCCELHRIV